MSTLSPIPSGELGTLGKRRAPVWIPGERWGGDRLCPSGQVGGKWGGGAWEGPRGTPERLCHRALRLVHVCMAVEPLARIIRVILQSVPDMANIMTLILFFMLVSALPHPQLLPFPDQNPQVTGDWGEGVDREEERPLSLNPWDSLGSFAWQLLVLSPRWLGKVQASSLVSPAGVFRVWGHSLWCVSAQAFPKHAGCSVYPLHLHHPRWLGGYLQ